jgi:hypothetical protein
MQEALLDEARLRAAWASLRLPERCRAVWETKFPDLAA